MKDKKKLVVLIGVIGLLLAILGLTYAYFTASIAGNENATSVIVGTAKLGLVYDSGDTIIGNKIIPGWSETKIFSVTNNSNVSMYYSINWIEVINIFVNKSDLVYILSGANSKEETIVPSIDEVILEGIKIEPEEVHNYTLTITYKNTSSDQSADMGKSFIGRIKINESSDPVIYLKDQILTNNGGASIIEIKPDPNFANVATTNEGMYAIDDEYGTSYYYRGAVTNNNVIFGGFQWKIIRINGDGSVRLIYNGTCPENNCIGNFNTTGSGTQISGIHAWNTTNNNDAKYLGYMYGGANGVASWNYAGATTNTTSTNAKTQLDLWYTNNIENQGSNITSKIVDNIFCNDRKSYTNPAGTTAGGGYGDQRTYYGAYVRLITNKSPSLKCTNTNDQFTISGSSRGNKALSKPIGLITSDEIALAGGKYSTVNSSYYLYTGQVYRTMSPFNFLGLTVSIFIVNGQNSLYEAHVNLLYGLRPVINLSSSIEITSGDGTTENPYIITE